MYKDDEVQLKYRVTMYPSDPMGRDELSRANGESEISAYASSAGTIIDSDSYRSGVLQKYETRIN